MVRHTVWWHVVLRDLMSVFNGWTYCLVTCRVARLGVSIKWFKILFGEMSCCEAWCISITNVTLGLPSLRKYHLYFWKKNRLMRLQKAKLYVPTNHSIFPMAVKNRCPVVSHPSPFFHIDNCWTCSRSQCAWNICHWTLSNQQSINQSILLHVY